MGQIVSMMKEMGYLKMFGMNVSDVFKSSFEKIVNPCAIRAAHNLGIPIKTEGLRSINAEGEWIEQAALKQNLPRDFLRGFLLAGIAIASKAIGVKN